MRLKQKWSIVVLTCALTAAMVGCQDGDPNPTQATSPATASTPSATGAAGADTPKVAAATGILVEAETYTYHLIEGVEWDLGRGGLTASNYDEELNPFDVSGRESLLFEASSKEIDDDFERSITDARFKPPFIRGENRVVNGIEGWTAHRLRNEWLDYEFGTTHNLKSVGFWFSFPNKDPRAREWIDAILASVEWK